MTTLVDPFLCMAMQRAVSKCGSQPVKGATGTVAPVDYKMFKCVHHMLVSQLPIPRAGHGISMNRFGGPVQKTGMNGGSLSFGFEVVMTEVVASVTTERSWTQRASACTESHKVACGPVFHLSDGCIGCVACPLAFTFKPAGRYAGLKVGTMTVRHDYFVLDIAGEFRGMGVTRRRDEEAAVLNRVMLCQHANRLRSRGAIFSDAQVATIELHLNAVLRSLPVGEEEDDGASADAEEGLEDDAESQAPVA